MYNIIEQKIKKRKGGIKMNKKEIEMRKKALEIIIEALDSGWRGYCWDLLHEIYMERYIVGRHRAEKELEKFGVFRALEMVRDYELENFGKIKTNFANPEELINKLFCIIAEEVLYELWELVEDEWEFDYEYIDEKVSNKILEVVRKK